MNHPLRIVRYELTPDEALEAEIRSVFERWMCGDKTIWGHMVDLINSRSPGQVRKMEKAMKLDA